MIIFFIVHDNADIIHILLLRYDRAMMMMTALIVFVGRYVMLTQVEVAGCNLTFVVTAQQTQPFSFSYFIRILTGLVRQLACFTKYIALHFPCYNYNN